MKTFPYRKGEQEKKRENSHEKRQSTKYLLHNEEIFYVFLGFFLCFHRTLNLYSIPIKIDFAIFKVFPGNFFTKQKFNILKALLRKFLTLFTKIKFISWIFSVYSNYLCFFGYSRGVSFLFCKYGEWRQHCCSWIIIYLFFSSTSSNRTFLSHVNWILLFTNLKHILTS